MYSQSQGTLQKVTITEDIPHHREVDVALSSKLFLKFCFSLICSSSFLFQMFWGLCR